MNIRTKVNCGVALIFVVVLAGAVFTQLSERQQRTALNEVESAVEAVTGRSMALMHTAKDVELDVVQVQQFLSDISATRGEDGLDDGLKQAQEFADKFTTDVASATRLAEAMGRRDVVELLAETKLAFTPYYAFGRRMAQAYIDTGPVGGNAMMPEFDKSSEALQASVERLLSLVDAAVSQTVAQLKDTVAGIQKAGDELVLTTSLLGALGLVVAAGIGVIAFTGIVRPLGLVTVAMRLLAGGDIAVVVPGQGRRDEIGAMAAAVLVFRDHMVRGNQLSKQQADESERAAAEKRAALTGMAETIEAETGAALEQIRQRTVTMTTTAEEMSASAARTGNSAQSASVASAQALATAQTVAAAAEELSASIREIGGQMAKSTEIVSRAVAAGADTRATIDALNEKVARIGAVADMIGGIAGRTNLLALNATIEAARAGDAGKGFAVVASEVKALATQTARSTQEIAQHIAQVRSATGVAVAAVMRIEQTIGEMNEIAGSIAAAVEEQGAATAEIARNVAETASAATDMTSRTCEVSNEAERTGKHAAEVRETVTALNIVVGDLRHSVIRVVRTSSTEVDRRKTLRHQIDLPCRLNVPGQPACSARITDISGGGAAIRGGPSLSVGARGALHIDSVGFPVSFIVRRGEDDTLGVIFEFDEVTATKFRPILERLAQNRAA